MAMTTAEKIQFIVDNKVGNKEFALFFDGASKWSAVVGNPSSNVCLGEASGEFESDYLPSVDEALDHLAGLVISCGGVVPDPRSPEEIAEDNKIAAMSDDELRVYNEELVRNRREGEITVQHLRASWISAASIEAQPLKIGHRGTGSQDPSSFQSECMAQLRAVTEGDPSDIDERKARFIEEALELVQSLEMSLLDVLIIVGYVYGRPAGRPAQEFGGTFCTLAHLAEFAGEDLAKEGWTELYRTWTPEVMAKIRRKRAARHGRGPLPGLVEESK